MKLWWVEARERKKIIFLSLFCPKEIFAAFLFYFNLQSIEKTFRTYIFYISKNITSYAFLLFL